ncbi:MAG TPA: hypothetical protein VEC19_15500 [Usitatibacter sp.]|nr:hypothetical protein [Usitatibacter sp.]
MKKLSLLLLLAATSAAAGPFDQPYSIIATYDVPGADIHLRRVIVNRVDGENAMPDNRAVVAPGKHKVTVDLPPRRGFHLATQQTFDLETRPCVRYNVAAKLENSASQKWVPVVKSTERLGECESKFKLASNK